MPWSLEDVGLLDAPPEQGGKPLELEIALIDEDPNQPRSEFDETALQELAESIASRGVLQPVSVRPHPTVPGRWMLNFGARRLRGSRLAGKQTIRVFIDTGLEDYDQVIENEQREGLKALDLALFIQRRTAAGESKTQIARRLGKSKAYVTFASALIDAPGWLMAAYRDGQCTGIKELYELRRLHEANAPAVQEVLFEGSAITRSGLTALAKQSKEIRAPATTLPATRRRAVSAAVAAASVPSPYGSREKAGSEAGSTPQPLQPLRRLLGDWNGATVIVVVDQMPDATDRVYVVAAGRRQAIPASELRLRGFGPLADGSGE